MARELLECLENWVPKVSPHLWHGEASPAAGSMGAQGSASARHLIPQPREAWWF